MYSKTGEIMPFPWRRKHLHFNSSPSTNFYKLIVNIFKYLSLRNAKWNWKATPAVQTHTTIKWSKVITFKICLKVSVCGRIPFMQGRRIKALPQVLKQRYEGKTSKKWCPRCVLYFIKFSALLRQRKLDVPIIFLATSINPF